jgi:hypothetical protein
MPSYGMSRRGVLVRIDVSEEHIASIIRFTRIRELETMLTVNSKRRKIADSCHPDDGGATFLRNVDSHKSHAA